MHTFSKRPINDTLQEMVLSRWSGRVNLADISLPSLSKIMTLIEKMSDSGVGPDGIPYSCYRFDFAARIVLNLLQWILDGRGACDDLISSLILYLPKSPSADEVLGACSVVNKTHFSEKLSC